MSNRVMTTLEEMAPAFEIYLIDESFIFTNLINHLESLEEFGRRVRARIKQETYLTVGVGIEPPKTLAKLANHAAKKWSKTGGVLDLSNIDRQTKVTHSVGAS